MQTRTVAALVIVLAFGATAAARADQVDDYIRAEMQKRHIPGLSLAIVRAGKVVKEKGYGLADLEHRTPAKPDTVYQLASLTKQFTATAILLLVQDGRLQLDDKISRFVGGTPDSWKDITLRHLLTHTSGIKEYLDESPDSPTSAIKSHVETSPEQIVQSLAAAPLEFAPGEKYHYCNTNYLLLSMVIRRVSGKPYDQFLAEQVFRPLGMTATRLTNAADVIPNRAAGYTWAENQWQNSPALNPTLWDNGDGGILSTVRDLARWDAALYTDTPLTESSRTRMGTPARLNDGSTDNYGLGWGIGNPQGHRRIWHAGGRPGTSTALARYVDDKLTIIVLINRDGVSAIELVNRLAGFYIPDLAPPVYKTIRDREPQVTARIEAMMRGAAQGTSLPIPARIPIEINGFPAPIRSGKDLLDTIQSLGDVTSITLVERKNTDNTRLYRYRVTYRNSRLLVGFWFNGEDRIVKASFQLEQ